MGFWSNVTFTDFKPAKVAGVAAANVAHVRSLLLPVQVASQQLVVPANSNAPASVPVPFSVPKIGIAIVPEAVGSVFYSDNVRLVRIPGSDAIRTYVVAWHRNVTNPAAKLFLGVIRELFD